MPVRVQPVDLGASAHGWFTGRATGDDDPPVGRAGNLSALRPHLPDRLAADRADACRAMGLDAEDLTTMRQVHGARVGHVGRHLPRGAQVRGVDALVTHEVARPLVVFTADCVPVLLAAPHGVAAVHAGRLGLAAGVVPAALEALAGDGDAPVRAVIGPAIRGCCYEVPESMRDEVVAEHPAAGAETSWGSPALDLAAGVAAQLADADVEVQDVAVCTHCAQDEWFSHRADPGAGRQAGVVVHLGSSQVEREVA